MLRTVIWLVLSVVVSVVVFWWAGTSLVKRWQPAPIRVFGWVLAYLFLWPGLLLTLIRWKAMANEYQREARNTFAEHWSTCEVCSDGTGNFCDTGRDLLGRTR